MYCHISFLPARLDFMINHTWTAESWNGAATWNEDSSGSKLLFLHMIHLVANFHPTTSAQPLGLGSGDGGSASFRHREISCSFCVVCEILKISLTGKMNGQQVLPLNS